jgi:replicative DNA helicase
MKQQHGIQAVVIDYLQLMTSGHRTESRQQEVSEISRGVKALARELEIPVICLSQLNRAAEQREGPRPRMSDLRESGSIEQDADVVMMLHRESYYHRDEEWREENPDKVNLAELILTKQRNGPTGTIKLNWDSRSTRFREYVDAVQPGGGASWGQPPVPPVADDGDLPI